MKAKQSIGTVIFKVILGIQAIACLGLVMVGLYYGQWYGGFGLVLLSTTLICSLPVYFPPDVSISPAQTISVTKPERKSSEMALGRVAS